MSGLFGGSPSAPTPPPAPTVSDAEVGAADKADQLRRRRGMAATILAGANGQNTPTTQSSALLGS